MSKYGMPDRPEYRSWSSASHCLNRAGFANADDPVNRFLCGSFRRQCRRFSTEVLPPSTNFVTQIVPQTHLIPFFGPAHSLP